jgi:hypothetical protein
MSTDPGGLEPTTLEWRGVLAVDVEFAQASLVKRAITQAETRTGIKLRAKTDKTRRRCTSTCTFIHTCTYT